MLMWLFDQLAEVYSGFNVFRYLTLRGICAVITALALALITGPKLIQRLNQRQLGQPVRDNGPQSHLVKQGTPTMGGAFILLSMSLSTLFWADLHNRFIWISLLTCIGFGVIGWVDDLTKIVHKDPRGIGSRNKFVSQCLVGTLAASALYLTRESDVDISYIVPFVKDFSVNFGAFFIPIATFWIVGFSNAVNLTDGLDGLAIMPTVLVAGALAIFSYASGHVEFSNYLGIPYIPGVGELLVFCAALVGAGLGFLWFNAYPAQVFMGDVGALALGAALATVAICVRQEIVLLLMGGIFVIETLSVMIQVASFKLLGRRVFRMAPLHHHYELKGWPEPHVIVRFWIISLILVLVGLATLKIR